MGSIDGGKTHHEGGHSVRRPMLKSPAEALQPDPVPPPPPLRSKRARHPVIILLNGAVTFLFFVLIVLGIGLYYGSVQFYKEGPLRQDRITMITPGMNARTIAAALERNNIITNRWVFLAGLRAYQSNSSLKAGEYLIKAKASMSDVMDTLVEGRAILHTLTIPEGLTSKQIVERLRNDPILVGDITEVPDEGTLLPETYTFTRGQTRQYLLNEMKTAHIVALEEAWRRRGEELPIMTPRQLVILASIVEKETGKADERPRIAGVFINRLRKKMQLQSDPTILYGLFKGDAWDKSRTIFRSQLNAPNSYNTYQISGLPPGPIANPGKAALEAVANPSRTKDLFFVADGTGGHVFAETLAAHNRNVTKWRAIEKVRAAEKTTEKRSGSSSDN